MDNSEKPNTLSGVDEPTTVVELFRSLRVPEYEELVIEKPIRLGKICYSNREKITKNADSTSSLNHEVGWLPSTIKESRRSIHPRTEFDTGWIARVINGTAPYAFDYLKPEMEFDDPLSLTIEPVDLAYDSNQDKLIKVPNTPVQKYEWRHRFATASVVGDQVRFIIAILPLLETESSTPSLDKGQLYRNDEVVREILKVIGEQIKVNQVYAHREFYSARAVAALEERDIGYVIPALLTAPVQRFVRRVESEVRIRFDYQIYSAINKPDLQSETNLVGLPVRGKRTPAQPFVTDSVFRDRNHFSE